MNKNLQILFFIYITLFSVLSTGDERLDEDSNSNIVELNTAPKDPNINYQALIAALDLSGVYEVSDQATQLRSHLKVGRIEIGFKENIELSRQRYIEEEPDELESKNSLVLQNPGDFFFAVSGAYNQTLSSVLEMIESTKNFFSYANLINDPEDFLNYKAPTHTIVSSIEDVTKYNEQQGLLSRPFVKTHFNQTDLENGAKLITFGTVITTYGRRDRVIRPDIIQKYFLEMTINPDQTVNFKFSFTDHETSSSFFGVVETLKEVRRESGEFTAQKREGSVFSSIFPLDEQPKTNLLKFPNRPRKCSILLL